jgi:hypothetical protein
LRSPNGHGTVSAQGTPKSSPQPTFKSTTPRSTATPSGAPPTARAGRLPLVVLNNTTTSGLAERARARFEAGGWTVTRTGNLSRDILSTCAYFDPAVPGAQVAARALQAQFPTIKRVVKKFPALPPGPVVVVLTQDYS